MSKDITPFLNVSAGSVAPPPTNVLAAAGNASATVQWLARKAGVVTGYTVTASPGGASVAVAYNSALGSFGIAIVTGLINGTSYTFTVTANNSVGSSLASAASNAVTPSALPSSVLPVTRALEFWWSSAQVISPPADGSPLTSLTDFSGNGYNAAGSGTGSGGTWKASWSSSKPAVQLNGTNQRYDTTSTGLSAGMRSPEATIYAVVGVSANPNGNSQTGGRIISQEGNSAPIGVQGEGFAVGVGSTGGKSNIEAYINSTGSSASTFAGSDIVLATPTYITVTAPGALRVNGVAVAGTVNPLLSLGANGMWSFGAQIGNAFNKNMQGYIAELIIFYATHTPTEIAAMETYLAGEVLMPNAAVPAGFYIGVEPPANPAASTRWISQSHKHLQVPMGKYTRRPIIGSGVGGSATQEMSPWWNPTLQRFEALVNISSAQYFTYAADPWGPWATPIKVLGGNTGGESGTAQQCSVYVENGNLYAIYMSAGATTIYSMAKAAMPVTIGANPSFSKLGTVFTDAGSVLTGNSRVINVNGIYYLFADRGGNTLRLAQSAAATMDGLISTPFAVVVTGLKSVSINTGYRYDGGWGRPMPIYEPLSGTWILYVHLTNLIDFGYDTIYRFTCQDQGVPVNWTPDPDGPFIRAVHQLEVDQVADFACCQGADEKWWAFWTGANNLGVAFSIFAAPMLEPTLSYGGNEWTPTQSQSDPRGELGYINPDIISTNTNLGNQWDCVFDTSSGALTGTFPVAGGHSFLRVSNYPATLPGNPVKLVPLSSSDKIIGPNPVTAISASGTTVTMTTKKPHNLTTSDFVTVSGMVPSGYNVNGVAVASVVDANNITYTAGSSPAAVTTIGGYESSLDIGETRVYRVRGTLNGRTWFRS